MLLTLWIAATPAAAQVGVDLWVDEAFQELRHGPSAAPPEGLPPPPVTLEAPAPAPPPAAARLVVVVVVPGLTGELWRRADSPTLNRLAAQGVYSRELAPAGAPGDLPALATVLTGLDPTRHGVRAPRWRAWVGHPPRPTLLAGAREAGLEALVLGASEDVLLLRTPGVPFRRLKTDPWHPQGSAGPLADAAVEALRAGRRGLVVLHLPDVADHGRRYGATSREALRAVGRVDGALGRIVAHARDGGLAAATTWVVVGTPGAADPGSRLTWILAGAGVGTDGDLLGARLVDVAPTVAAGLAGAAPAGLDGRIRMRVLTVPHQENSPSL